MLTGTHRLKITQKNRIALPAAWREDLATEDSQEIYLLRNRLQIDVYNPKSFSQLEKEIGEISRFHQDVQEYKRFLYSGLYKENLDSQGRILLSKDLLDQMSWTDVNTEVFIIGVGDHAEIWLPHIWEIQQTRMNQSILDTTNRLAMLIDKFNKTKDV